MKKKLIIAAMSVCAIAGAIAEEPPEAGTVCYTGLPDGLSVTNSTKNLKELTGDVPSPFNVAEAWADGNVPHKGPVYEAGRVQVEGVNKDSHLWTPYTISDADTVYDMFSTLVLKTGCTFWPCHRGKGAAVFNDLRVDGTPSIYGVNNAVTLAGKISIPQGSELKICAYNNRRFNVNSDLYGDGVINMYPQDGTSAKRSYYSLKGNNGSFFGKVKATGHNTSTLSKNFPTLYVSDETVLGGVLPQFTHDALQLSLMAQISAESKGLVLSESSNRGMLIGSGNGRIEVTETAETLTVNWPITMSPSRLYKEGPGMLVLGKPLRFLDSGASVENPTGDGHYIDVTAGSVAVTDCNALNGARIAFSNQTELVVHIGAGNEDFKRYGARFDKVSAPFATGIPLRIEVSADEELTEMSYSVALLTVKQEDAEDAKSKLSASFNMSGYVLNGVEAVLDENTGLVTFVASVVKTVSYVGLPGGESVSVSINDLRNLTGDVPSPFEVADAWSDGAVPHNGPVYLAGQVQADGVYKDSHLWTPYAESDVDTVYDMFSTLVLKTGCTFWLCHSGKGAEVFNDLRVDGKPAIYGVNGTVTLDGKIFILQGSELKICAYNNKSFNVNSDLYGDGVIYMIAQAGTKVYGGTYSLNGMNEEFLGKVKVSSRGTPTFSAGFSTLLVSNGTALGGRLPQVAYDALQVSNMARFRVEEKGVVLSEESNRGMLIGSGNGRIEVTEAAETLTVNWPITMSPSRLYKEGLGMLVLGKPLRFLDSGVSVESPTGDGHYIDVTAGSVAVADCDALNGARIAFSNETELVVHVGADNEGLKRYGARFDKVSAPFATEVPVRIEAPTGAELTEGVYSVALLTVKREDAEDAKAKLVVSSKVDGYAVKGMDIISDEENVTVTFTAKLVKKGFVVTVR